MCQLVFGIKITVSKAKEEVDKGKLVEGSTTPLELGPTP
jgi:hypothetical protein